MIERLEGKHIILRKAVNGDLKAIFHNVWADERLSATMLWKNTYELEEAEKRLERTVEYQKIHDGFFVCLKENDEAIGFAGIKKSEEGTYEESGVCIACDFQNRGYGHEVMELLLKLAFEINEGERFIYSAFSDNERSKKLCLDCGFKFLERAEMKRPHDGKEFVVYKYYLDRKDYHDRKL